MGRGFETDGIGATLPEPIELERVQIAAGCSLECRFCTHSQGSVGSPMAEVLAESFPIPTADRVLILAGDVLRVDLASLVRRIRAAGARDVFVYAHPGSSPDPGLDRLQSAGITGIHLVLPAADRPTLTMLTGGKGKLQNTARLIDRANEMSLAVAVEIPLVRANLDGLPETVERALNRIHRPDRFIVRFLSDATAGTPRGWDHGSALDAVSEAMRISGEAHVPFEFGRHEAPPPCILDLPEAVPSVYQGLGNLDHTADRERPFDACSRCDIRRVCQEDALYTAPTEPSPIRGESVEPGNDLVTSSAELFLRQEELSALQEEFRRLPGTLCRFPWESIEAHDISGVVTPCAGGWPLEKTRDYCTSWHGESLLESWNSPGMQSIRRNMASFHPEATCRPECPAFHGGTSTANPPLLAATSRRFHHNRVMNFREMLNGAEVLRSRPLSIAISPTTRCFNRCRMCNIHEKRALFQDRDEIAEMTDGFYQELLDLLPTTGMLALTGGEPLISRRVRDLLREFHIDRYPDGGVTITTNGLLLRKPLLRDLRNTPLRTVYVSLNAATDATYEYITRTRGGFERVLANLHLLMDEIPHLAGRPRVTLSFVVMRSNFRELPGFLQLARDLKVDVRLIPVERNRCGESIFTDEETLDTVIRLLASDVRPLLIGMPYLYSIEVNRLDSILRGRLERRDFRPL